jgi:hypothetical protein
VRLRVVVAAGEENHADAEVLVAEEGLLFLFEKFAEEFDGDLGEDAGAVAGDGVGVDGAAVREGLEGGDGAVDDIGRAFAGEFRDEADAACVVLLIRMVQGGRDRGGHGKREFER